MTGADKHAPGDPVQRGGVRRSLGHRWPSGSAGSGATATAPRPLPRASRSRWSGHRRAGQPSCVWEAAPRWARRDPSAGPWTAQDARALQQRPHRSRHPGGYRRVQHGWPSAGGGDGQTRVHPGRGACARADDGDGFGAGPVHTMEGCWSLGRSGRRPHRGMSHETLPLSVGCCEFVHNVRQRGKAFRGALIELLVTEDPGIQ